MQGQMPVQDGISTRFQQLQKRFAGHYQEIFYNDLAEKTVVIVPSLTLDRKMLESVTGHMHYEERLLCLLMLLRMPRTTVIYVSSQPIDASIIDYYLHLLPGITGYHARQRLHLFSCYDGSSASLTQKILDRPRVVNRIRALIVKPELAHMVCFNVTELEAKLSEQLDIPVYGCDPALSYLGSKSGSRDIFRQLNVPMPEGFENLEDEEGIVQALVRLKQQNPLLKRAVVKINEGFSGDGNAIFHYDGLDAGSLNLQEEIMEHLPERLSIVANGMGYTNYMNGFKNLGGIVEEFMEGAIKQSPSVQCRINPLGVCDIISTHDQVLGGESGQVFLGATFPARKEYSRELAIPAMSIAGAMQQLGVLGRFGIDFLSVYRNGAWFHYAIEINLRKGGTTHPFLMLQFLTNGEYDMQSGEYRMPNGQSRYYFASDNVENARYKGLTPHDLIDIAMCHKLLYDGAKQCGVMFHMIGALSEFGKLGMVCIGCSHEEARAYFEKTINVLNQVCKDCPGS